MDSEAWEQGKLAAANGETVRSNPYPEGDERQMDWEAGFEAFEDQDKEGNFVDEADRD